MNCEYALESMLDDMMFTYVKNDKEKMKKRFNMTDDELRKIFLL